MKRTFAFLGLAMILVESASFSSLEERTALFQQGVGAYQEGNFEASAQFFETLLQEGLVNGHVYYNLGNSYFRQGKLGLAIAFYLKAKQLLPRDQDLRHNLDYVRKQTKDRIEPTSWQSLRSSAVSWVDFLNAKEWFVVFLGCNAVLWTLMSLRLFRKTQGSRGLLWASLGSTLICTFALGFQYFVKNPVAVIIEPEVSVYSGPGSLNTELFRLHEGTEVFRLDQDQAWIRLKLADGKQGWIEKRFVADANS